MKTVTDDPYEFFKDGGWDFLANEAGGEEDSAESEPESDFDPVSLDAERSERMLIIVQGSAEASESASESDFSDAASESDASEELSDEGEDWSEQEEKAAKSDKKKAARSGEASDDDDRGKKSSKTKKR